MLFSQCWPATPCTLLTAPHTSPCCHRCPSAGLLAAQLTLTTVIGALMVFCAPVKAFVHANPWLLLASMLVSFGIILTFSFSQAARQSHPTNLILLFAFTVVEGVLVGAISSQYRTDVVVMAFGLTAGISYALCAYALNTKKDFTYMGGLLYTMLTTLVLTSLIAMFFPTPLMNLIISVFGALLFSVYMIYDVQMLVGGKHQFKLSPDEYVFGAVAIYLDIINLFLHILRILGSNRNN